MSSKTTFKCLHCNEEQRREPRCRGSQHYCSKPDCRRASKAASERKWASRPENQNYFRGTDNCERVRQWRLAHPGYWRNKSTAPKGTLQDVSTIQGIGNEQVGASNALSALQEICFPQPALLVGLISVLTGHALQEDLAASARLFLLRSHDILAARPKIHDSLTTEATQAQTPSPKAFGGNYAPSRRPEGTRTADAGLTSKRTC